MRFTKRKLVYKGSKFKKWFLNQSDVRRVLVPTVESYHIVNLDEIEDDVYYLVSGKGYAEVVIEEVELH